MKKVLIFSALFLLASVSLSAQVVKGAGLWYFNGLPNVTPSVATGTEIAYSINNKALFKWNRTTSAWVAVVQDSSITNELQDLILSNDTLSLTLSDSIVLMAQYRNHVWEITNLSDTTSITGDIEGDIAYTSTGDTIAFRGATAWLPFTGGGGGGTFNSFNIAGDTGSDIVTDGQTVTVAGGYGINTAETGGTVTVTADTTQLATQSDISGLPSGTGTNQRIVVWTGTNSQGNSTQLQSTAGVTLDANLAYRITGGTTASRPTGAAGMQYWNTSNGWFDFHNGTSWFNPLRSATATGLGTAGRVFYADASGLAASDELRYDEANNWFGINATPTHTITANRGTVGDVAIFSGGIRSMYIYSSNNGVSFGSAPNGASQNIAFSPASSIISFSPGGSPRAYMYTTGAIFSNEIPVGLPGRALTAEATGSAIATVGLPFRLTQVTTATAGAGFGTGMGYEAENASGTNRVIGQTEAVYTTATNAAEVSDFVISTMRAGTLTESLRSLGNGTLQVGTLTGTATQWLGATAGNILTTITPGYGLTLASGAVRVDTTALKAQFLPLTLTGTTTFNTSGNLFNVQGRMSFVSSAAETWPITFLSQEYDGIDFQQNRGSNSVYGDLIGGFQCRPRYNGGINSEVAAIFGRYTGNGTTRRGEMVITAHNGTGLTYTGVFSGDTVLLQPIQRIILKAPVTEVIGLTDEGIINISEDADNGVNYRGITVDAAITTSETFKLTGTDGTTGQQIITAIPTITATLDFGNTAAGTVSDLTVTVTGAAVGDIVTIGVPHGSVPAAGTFFAWVSATNTVTVRFANNALITAYDPGSGSFKVRVEK